jgi:competence protein CoiA
MRFAIVDGEKREAEKELTGLCVGCEKPMIPVCGIKKVKHWRHKVDCECDHWWENETEWHRSWKNHFPTEWQEIRHRADDGEWHIADVKTKADYILEFQHSSLNPEERQARNKFYGNNLVWVVDGLKRKNDLSRFHLFLKNAKPVVQGINLARIPSVLDECSLLKEWSACSGPVFFDFGFEFPLWCLLPKTLKAAHYIGPFSRQNFIELHNGLLTQNGKTFSELMKVLTDIVFAYENPQQQIARPHGQGLSIRQPMRQRQVAIPANPSQKYLFYLNRSPQRRFKRF